MQKTIFTGEIKGVKVEHKFRPAGFEMSQKHFHSEYELYYLAQGEREYFINSKTYHIKRDNFVFIPSNQIHKTSSVNELAHERILIMIDREEIEKMKENFPLLPLKRLDENCIVADLEGDNQTYAKLMLAGIVREMREKKRGYQDAVKIKMMDLLIFLLRMQKEGEEEEAVIQTPKHQKIYEIADYLLKNYRRNENLEELSEKFYISKFYLCRSFKEVTGMGMNEYIHMARIKQAVRLLEDTSWSVSRISEEVGYDSVTYFEKVFKKYMQFSPLGYKKRRGNS